MPGFQLPQDLVDRVQFHKPDVDAILEEGLMCADMHFHTNYSDSFTKVEWALALAEKRRVGLTMSDHNLIGGITKAFEINKPDGPFLVPGIELGSWEGPHILAYFYSLNDLKDYWEHYTRPHLAHCPWLNMNKGVEWILDSLEGYSCVVSAAHPLGYLWSTKGIQKAINKNWFDEDIAKRFDAYEAICSGMFRNENIASRDAAIKYGLGFTGGSDGHLLSEVGKVLTVSDATDLDSFLDNIVKHKNIVVGKEKMIPKKFVMGTTSLIRFATRHPISSFHTRFELIRYNGTHDKPGS